MNPMIFIVIAVILLVLGMYCFSMFWYFVVSKNKSVYIVEGIAFTIGLIGIIVLISVGYSAEMGDALAAIFGAFFLIPVVLGSLITALFVKITIVLIEK